MVSDENWERLANTRAEGNITLTVREWGASSDDSWPDNASWGCVNIQPIADDLFTPHFSVSLIGTPEELRRLASEIASAADCIGEGGVPAGLSP